MADKIVRQQQFIAAYVENGGDKKAAAEQASIALRSVQRWFSEDLEFNEKLKKVFSEVEPLLLQEAVRRALEGSDNLLKFLLKSMRPEVYDDNYRKQLLANEGIEKINQPTDSEPFDPIEYVRELAKVDPYVNYQAVIEDASSKSES